MRRGYYALLGVVLCTALVLGLLLSRIRSGPGLPTGERSVGGVDGPIEILWDSVGIPHVYATTQRDALFAQGYLHATHRLWQVEMFRRVAQGRLSELFGEATLDTDRFLRTLGMDRAAAASLPLLGEEDRRLLQGYVDGLNAAIEGWAGLLPPEFLVLGARPEPYRIEDVLALEKVMAWDLADYQSSLDLAAAHARLGDEGFERVRPGYPAGGMTILQSAGLEPDVRPGRGGTVPGDSASIGSAGARMAAGRDGRRQVATGPVPVPAGVADTGRLALVESARAPREAFSFLSVAGAVHASNAWVVGPERSASGRPLVANDMHLTLDRPVIWYLIRLHAPGLDVAGMSLPGTAGVVAGRTGGVAWGFTNAMVDDAELFVERLDPEDGDRYLTPAGSESFEFRREVIRVRDGSADTLVVRATRHGPVITDVERRADGELFALRWVALDPSTTAAALLGMNRASSVEEFLGALRGFSDPHQNVVFADTAGAWGYWMAGRIPDRPSPRPSLLPVPGWTGEADWRGYLPFEAHPHALEPPSGLVATANNRQARGPMGDRINGGDWATPYRAQRIADLLAARTDHDVASLHAIQRDITSLLALDRRNHAIRAFRLAGEEEAARSLEAWDGRGTTDSREATLFHAWYEAVRSGLKEEVYGEPRGYLSHRADLRAFEEGRPDDFWVGTARTALARDTQPWGEVHRLTLDHPLSQVPVLQGLLGLARRGIPREGTPHTVNVAEYGSAEDGSFPVRRGPSERHVSDLSDLDAGGFVLPGGQSGYPGARHAFDQFPVWRDGGLIPVPMSRAGAEARSVGLLRLVPGGAR